MNITANQLSAIDRIVTEFRGDRLAVSEVSVTVCEGAWGDGGICVSVYHPGHKPDGSDWSFYGTTVFRDGAEILPEPAKPWELA